MTTLRPVLDRESVRERLVKVFPPEAFDAVLSSPLAAAGVAAMIYVGSVVADEGDPEPENVWSRPSTVLWMSDTIYAHASDDERLAYAGGAAVSKKRIEQLAQEWGDGHHPWYADNSRETLRDEIWPKWRENAAARVRTGIATSSSLPRWALAASFADLFDPALDGDALDAAIADWQDAHLNPGAKLKLHHAAQLAKAEHEVTVQLPGYGTRVLDPGVSSMILKGVIEQWAPARLAQPVVLAISQSGDKLYVVDQAVLAQIGISINVSSVLPDAIVVDVGVTPATFWIIEAVATDGEINETRKENLIAWAVEQYIAPEQLQFLSAFASRNAPTIRRRLKDIASGTYCWFLDEPGNELSWREI
ncbi:BsuBI/PstI family type II restriction endonuclease [Mycobacterium sp. TY814]|uniref:BsuBI/PstI family type II restriction endonuclease n=1 Tax=Mycobacterium sp. TY814 TaxID=3050580 RepID=UPI002742881D|nr:BsuBI/PstI family type II restriction endonuclease [Mycobacterium sp. TY814]MDP7724384.1 BsuBI/PstI family type II restriction endonuclease [Mycobacterium sp. TY814]